VTTGEPRALDVERSDSAAVPSEVPVSARTNVIPFPVGDRPPGEGPPERAVGPGLRDVLGDVLREERHRQERTLADVADAAAVSLPYLSEIERGRKDVSSDVLDAVCDALDVALADVLERCAGRLRARAQGGRGIQLRAA
jgi:DNA-binding Xre family transcriptional regulator